MYAGNSNNPPFDYRAINSYNADRSPSTIHVKNTLLRQYFEKYLLQKAISVFKWSLPEQWDKDYFLYSLYTAGYIAVLNTPKYGTICQWGALGGYNLYYRPTYVIITNPHIKMSITAKIGKDCEIIKLQPDYTGIMDIIGYYADQLAICAESLGLNILNVQSATIFAAKNQAQATAYKKMFDKVASGEPAIVIGKDLMNADGSPSWFPFTQHIKESYVASDLLSDMRKIIADFDTMIGIRNANTDKRERLITPEVNANNEETQALGEIWLESLKTGIDKANKMFNINIEVDWRVKPEQLPEVNTNE